VMSGTAILGNDGACVEQGRLYANGSIYSVVSVDPGAVLRGLGLITGAVTVQGTLAPGNSPGTLTVAGSVTMQAGSVYQEDINGIGFGAGPGNYSRLLVTGTTNQFIATGATLDVNLLNITGTATYTPLQPALGESFNIVTAAGGIVGKFAAFSQPEGLAANTRLAIFYDPFGDNSIDLRVVPTSYTSFLQAAGADGNARSAGNAMNQILSTDQSGHTTVAQDELAYTIGGISAAALPGVMTALAGELHADLAAVAPQAGQWLQASVARQLEFSDADGEFGAPLPGRAFWFDTTADHAKWDADDQASGFTTNRSQSALGFDLLAGHGNRVGIGYSHSLIDISTLTGSGSIDENIGFIYGQYSLAPVIVDAMVGAGTNHWETDRADPLAFSAATLDTNVHGSTEFASVGIRLPWRVGSFDLEPYARTLWQQVARTSFNEGTTLDDLSGLDFSAAGLRTTAGVLLGPKNPSPLALPFSYQVNLGAGYDSGSLVHPSVAAVLAGMPTKIVAPDIGRTFGQFSLNGTARLGGRTYAYAGLSDEVRSGKAEDAGINVGVRAIF
jgi:fibronectin-binding autotransporter adhesin